MAKVEAINTKQSSPYSVFGSLGKGIVGGGILGYAAKHVLPIDKKEWSDADRIYVSVIREQSKKTKGIPIEAIRSLEEKTPAQDVFLKWVDGRAAMKNAEGKAVNLQDPMKLMEKCIKEGHLDENGKNELRNIISQVNTEARNIAKRHIKTHIRDIKMDKRPAMAYITMGAVVGFFAGLVNKIITG